MVSYKHVIRQITTHVEIDSYYDINNYTRYILTSGFLVIVDKHSLIPSIVIQKTGSTLIFMTSTFMNLRHEGDFAVLLDEYQNDDYWFNLSLIRNMSVDKEDVEKMVQFYNYFMSL